MIAETSFQADRIQSELVSYPSRGRGRIVAFIDRAADAAADRPWVVMAPKYGETKKNNLKLAYLLAANGVNVLRFDLTNHVGESDGRMEDFTMPGAVEDLISSLDYLDREHGVSESVVVSSSLSSRCAIRAAVLDRRITKLVCIVGVVNLHATLREVYREDIFGTFLDGRRWGLTDILGFDINGVTFLSTAVEAKLHDLDGTIEDVARLRVPLVYFCAERDTWVSYDEVQRVFAGRPQCTLVPIKGAMHEVRENPRAADEVFQQVVWSCREAGPFPAGGVKLEAPDNRLLLAQNRRERERLQRVEPATEPESEFWANYLTKFSLLEKSNDYRAYLELVGRLCGSLPPGALVLDAGCGNGLFGLWVLRESLERRPAVAVLPPVYVGLDLTAAGLADASGRHAAVRLHHAQRRGPRAAGAPPGLAYGLIDFEQLAPGDAPPVPLPFADDCFDVICCSLVLSYLKQPQALLRELQRVLRPGGSLVLSSMKPFCDMSVIYRDFISQQVTIQDVEAARNLLRAAGNIKLKEEKGYYAFFSEEELAALTVAAGLRVASVHRSLGDQANVIKAVK
jgi:SAM-dependent methyltransferase/pimeloyl-ACP methyl ester carboxylesterase